MFEFTGRLILIQIPANPFTDLEPDQDQDQDQQDAGPGPEDKEDFMRLEPGFIIRHDTLNNTKLDAIRWINKVIVILSSFSRLVIILNA